MPQRQLPIFPAGVTEINRSIAVQKQDGQVWYVHGHLPVFHHEEEDIGSFRMFTSQMIVNGTVKPKEIVEGVWSAGHHGEAIRESVSRARSERVLRDQGAPEFGVGAGWEKSWSKRGRCWRKDRACLKWRVS